MNDQTQVEFRCLECPRYEGKFVVIWEGDVIAGTLDFIWETIEHDYNLRFHTFDYYNNAYIDAQLHDFTDVYYIKILKITKEQRA
jgi:hypothetical protein